MKSYLTAALLAASAGAGAQAPRPYYPSCNIQAQHAVRGTLGGTITDRDQAHIAMRANILQADIGNARKAGGLTEAQANGLSERVQTLAESANTTVKVRGTLGARERRTLDGQLDNAAAQVCQR